jgi:hypothetical protein
VDDDEQHQAERIGDNVALVRIPEYPATRSDDIRPLIPGYPASLGSASLSLFP